MAIVLIPVTKEISQDSFHKEVFGSSSVWSAPHPAAGVPDDFFWIRVSHFPLSLLGDPSFLSAWYEESKFLWESDFGTLQKFHSLEETWRTFPERNPIIVVQGEDSHFYLWDGNHRVGISASDGQSHVYATVGLRVYDALDEYECPACHGAAHVMVAGEITDCNTCNVGMRPVFSVPPPPALQFQRVITRKF